MATIEILRGVWINGVAHEAGAVVEVDDSTAAQVVQTGRARWAENAVKYTMREMVLGEWVTTVPGIGRKTSDKFAGAGVTNIRQLTGRSAEELAEATGLSVEKIQAWQREANQMVMVASDE